MQDHQLYQRILGIEGPWQVERVDLQLKEGEVHVYLTHQDNREWAGAECGVLCPLYDHQPERQWRHLDTCQYRTILHAEPPRSQCPVAWSARCEAVLDGSQPPLYRTIRGFG